MLRCLARVASVLFAKTMSQNRSEHECEVGDYKWPDGREYRGTPAARHPPQWQAEDSLKSYRARQVESSGLLGLRVDDLGRS